MDLPDLFPGFASKTIDCNDVPIFARIGGNPAHPPVVLLHGFPETHVMWSGIAGELAKDYRVIVPDLRGYGASGIVADETNHAQMSKRAMAADIVTLMAHLGHDQFAVVGHDRGARVAYRLALDHVAKVTRLAVLDIVPTSAMWAAMTATTAMDCYHWMFLAQPAPLPEKLIGSVPALYLEHTLASWTATKSLGAFSAGALAHYRANFAKPERIAACCEDYRAGWFYDRLRDEEDLAEGRTIDCPVLVLWGRVGLPAGAVDSGTTPLTVWRQWARNVEGEAIESGHFIPEENPAATLVALARFL